MGEIFLAGGKGGRVGELAIIPAERLNALRERVEAATGAMAVAIEKFGEVLTEVGEFADSIDGIELEAVECGENCGCEGDECALALVPMTAELEACMSECMMGDGECVSACYEQAKLTS